MTWNELANFIKHKMTPQQRLENVSIYVESMDEYFGGEYINIKILTNEQQHDVLDPYSFYLHLDG